MKLRITYREVSRLSPEQVSTLRSWWQPQEGDYLSLDEHEEMVYFLNGINRTKAIPLLNLGQMVQFLDERKLLHTIEQRDGLWTVNNQFSDSELCNALWQAVEAAL
ncbi:hypothetical protein B5M42_012070 [Paenibacillus athensensis]|uniref:Uncharacterized protein n=1 Tax=Paenibacillus athensensis TaxID=1967502 RepID=A0A4Y8Q5B0_9BACL|nr:hypothetical protein [Paenibacillus athensensis]MCD1259567.1 hypothetical protein [Paenibacillus athensensis]